MSHGFTRRPDYSDKAPDTVPTLIRIAFYPPTFAFANLTPEERIGLSVYRADGANVYAEDGTRVGMLV